jgi:hypothetical protein
MAPIGSEKGVMVKITDVEELNQGELVGEEEEASTIAVVRDFPKSPPRLWCRCDARQRGILFGLWVGNLRVRVREDVQSTGCMYVNDSACLQLTLAY